MTWQPWQTIGDQLAAGDPVVTAAALLHFTCLLVVGRRPHLGRVIGFTAAALLVVYGWLAAEPAFYRYTLAAAGYLWLLTTRHSETWRAIPTPRQIRRTAGGCAGCCLHTEPQPDQRAPVYDVVRHTARSR